MRPTMLLVCFAASIAVASHSDAQARPSATPIAWPAPVGHSQPRARDIPPGISVAPSRSERDALDRVLDEKLQICRGC
jgi:hypothetical protein